MDARHEHDRPGTRPRASPLWQVYLVVGALLCALYVFVPPFAGSGPVFNLLGLSPGGRDPRRRPPLQARVARPVAAGSPSASLLFWLGDLYTYSYPRLFGTEVPFPSLGDGVLRARLPGADGRPADPRPPAQPGARPRRRDRLADHDARPRAALVGRADRAVPPRRRRSRLCAKLVSIAYPLGDILLLAAAIRLAVDTGKRAARPSTCWPRASSRCWRPTSPTAS